MNLVSELAPTHIYDEEASSDLRVAAGSDDIFKEEVVWPGGFYTIHVV